MLAFFTTGPASIATTFNCIFYFIEFRVILLCVCCVVAFLVDGCFGKVPYSKPLPFAPLYYVDHDLLFASSYHKSLPIT